MTEITTHFPPILVLWGRGLIVAVLAVLFGMLRPWAALIPAALALVLVVDSFDKLGDPALLEALNAYLGPGYFWHELSAAIFALAVAVVVFVLRLRRKRTERIDA